MTGAIHAVAAAVPGYCTSGHGILTQAEWQTCWKLGWNNYYYFRGKFTNRIAQRYSFKCISNSNVYSCLVA